MKKLTRLFNIRTAGILLASAAILADFSSLNKVMANEIADSETIRKYITQGALVVDVRTPEEFNAGHYKGSINIPLAELERNIKLFGDREKPIVVYCRTGNRSGKAKTILEKYGYKKVINGGGLSNMPR